MGVVGAGVGFLILGACVTPATELESAANAKPVAKVQRREFKLFLSPN